MPALFAMTGLPLSLAQVPATVSLNHIALCVAVVAATLGFAAKAGLVPLHVWLPAAHPEAPSSLSAPLSGVLTKTGIFGIIALFWFVIGSDGLYAIGSGPSGLSLPGAGLVAIGIVTMLLGEICAVRQTDIKRMFAYSTIGQIGEIVAVLGLGTWLAMTGALAHVLNHAIMKDLLFLAAGALILRVGSRNLADISDAKGKNESFKTCAL
jgi:formate hydrogenlyase subunit 3/multisubunit Na+/H+ antiporter MnhD subunit